MTRCDWSLGSERLIAYHDTEWGVPVHDDQKHFEFLVLDAFQAGLSWSTILDKREHFRRAFDGFDPVKIARYTPRRIERLMRDAGIVRNRMKIEATIRNAQAFLDLQEAEASFNAFVWGFVGGAPRQYRRRSMRQVPATTRQARALSAALKARRPA